MLPICLGPYRNIYDIIDLVARIIQKIISGKRDHNYTYYRYYADNGATNID